MKVPLSSASEPSEELSGLSTEAPAAREVRAKIEEERERETAAEAPRRGCCCCGLVRETAADAPRRMGADAEGRMLSGRMCCGDVQCTPRLGLHATCATTDGIDASGSGAGVALEAEVANAASLLADASPPPLPLAAAAAPRPAKAPPAVSGLFSRSSRCM